MKCPKCNYAYVKAIGKETIFHRDQTGKVEKGNSGRPLLSHTKAKKYFCKNCGELD